MTLGHKKLLVVIAGPTAVGKTAVGIALAKHYHTEILSADSRQFFKELSIGTAKPTMEEMNGVVHHFINSHTIEQEYSVGKYEEDAIALLEVLFQKHPIIFLVGGSGLYIKAVCEGLDDLPGVDASIRHTLNEEYQQNGLMPLLEELSIADPQFFEEVDQHNPHRIIRALEIIRGTGKLFSSFRNSNIKKRNFEILKLGIQLERSQLYQRIDGRMDMMLSNGLVEEAKSLISFKDFNALKTVGYEELFDFFEGKETWDQTVFLLKRNSRRYAKRQLTWFNKDTAFVWYQPHQLTEMVGKIDTLFDTIKASQ